MRREVSLQELGERVRPTALADQRALPVHDALLPLLPGGLQRGCSVQIAAGVPAATSLALALLVAPSVADSWVAVIGLPSLGLAAADGLGVDLRRLVLVVPPPPGEWATVLATMLTAFEVVAVRPPAPVAPADARRLAARARERGSVLVRLGPARWWPEAADVSLAVTAATWTWAGDRRRDDGAARGHLQARRVTVEATGRRAASQPRSVDLWLPGPDGALAAADPLAEVRRLVPAGRSGGDGVHGGRRAADRRRRAIRAAARRAERARAARFRAGR